MLTALEASKPPETPSSKSEASPSEPILPPWEKIKRGIKLTQPEKEELRLYREKNPLVLKEEVPVSLDELEKAQDKILKRITKGVGRITDKDLPKMLEIVRTAIQEKRGKGEKTKADEAIKPPSRAEMLAKVAGRRAEKVE